MENNIELNGIEEVGALTTSEIRSIFDNEDIQHRVSFDAIGDMLSKFGIDKNDEFVKNNIINASLSKWYALTKDLSVPENIRIGLSNFIKNINIKIRSFRDTDYEFYKWVIKFIGKNEFGIEVTDKMIENFEKSK